MVDLEGCDRTVAVRVVRVIRDHAPEAAVVCVAEFERVPRWPPSRRVPNVRCPRRVGRRPRHRRHRVRELEDGRRVVASPLSARQVEIIDCVAKGMTNDQVARLLGVSASTVKNHLYTACRRLGAASRSQAVAEAIRLGLIAP